MFYRNIISELNEWSERKNRKPLVLRGARQVGKTTAVHFFAQKFGSYIHLNLEKPADRTIFETSQPFSYILDSIFFLKKKPRIENNTLIFIDEIQYCPEAVALLRYFYEEAPQLHVIAAGSLLESLIDRNISFPVGRVEYLAVRPCSFTEFLGALDEKTFQEALKQWPFPLYAHQPLASLFNRYAFIGGMPAAVADYAQNNNLDGLQKIYQSLLAGYIDDVEKYANRNSTIQYIRHILRTGFKYGGQRIKFERFGESEYRSREMGEAFRTLEKTMLLELVYPATGARLPVLPDYKKSPKLMWLDSGLLNFAAGIQTEVFGATNLTDAWRGIVAEHITGQELLALNSSVLAHRFFWVRQAKNSNAEVDFLLPFKEYLIPVEVKSDAGTTLKSLHQYMDLAPHTMAVRFWGHPFQENQIKTLKGKEFTLLSIPFYLISEVDTILSKYI